MGEFSLVCEEGREGGRSVCSEICSAHVAFSQAFISYANRGRRERDLNRGKRRRRKGRKRETAECICGRKRERRVEKSR